ncbi:DUF5455 family protein [Halomonas organivorans]
MTMALPAIIGVNAVIGFLIKVVEWIVAKFAARITMKLAVSLAWVTFYIGLLLAMAATFGALLAGISMTLPASLAEGLALVKPDNFEACIGAILSAKVTVWVFEQKRQLITWERYDGGYGKAGRIV